MTLHWTRLPLCLPLVCLPLAAAGSAQNLQEQVITRAPDTVPLLQAPLAASVFDSSTLDLFGIDSNAELAARSPGLVANDNALQIRGIGGASGSARTTAVFSDGVYMGDLGQADNANFFDMQQIEVIRGPSGVRDGFNAMGGAIRLFTAPPTTIWQSKVVAELGSDDYRALQGLIRGPITEQFYMSVAASTLERDAWDGRETQPGENGARDNQYLRGAFTYHWTNLWYSTLQILRSDTIDSDLDSAYLLNEVALGQHRVKYMASLTERGGLQAAESTIHKLQWYSDFAGAFNFDNGLYWHRLDDDTSEQSDAQSTALSAWADLNWSLSNALKLNGGIRYTEEEREAAQTQRDDYWDWQLGLDYQWQQQLFYAVTHSGHGSLTERATPAASQAETDALSAVEIGHKGSFLTNQLQTTLAVYYYDLHDLADSRGHASGAEIQANWTVQTGLNIGGSWAVSDSALPAPRHQLALFVSGQWRWGWARMEGVLEYLHRDAYCPAETRCTDSRTQWDGSLSALYGLWRLTAYVDNISDEDSALVQAPDSPLAEASGAPRSVGLRLAYQL